MESPKIVDVLTSGLRASAEFTTAAHGGSVTESLLQICGGKRFGGGSMKNHGNKKARVDSLSTVEKESRYVNLASQVHILSNHQ